MNSRALRGLSASLPRNNLFSEEDALHYLSESQRQRKPLTTFLIENQIISSEALALFCEQEYGLPLTDLDTFNLDELPSQYLNEALIEKYHALPVYTQGQTLFLAMSDPTNLEALEGFSFHFGLHTEGLLVEEMQLQKAMHKVHEQGWSNYVQEPLEDGFELMEVVEEQAYQESGEDSAEDDAPIVRYINKLLMDAIRQGASDLHFEPYEFQYRVRFRIDGILHEVASPPVQFTNRFAARIKVISKLDIAERRLPQDGRIKLKLGKGKNIDLRVSTLPTLWGEKLVLRILDSSTAKLDMEKLGFDAQQLELFEQTLQAPQGMILVTGPTGSGKTLSLYAGLNTLNDSVRNISTAEDPVEINLPGINQVQINPKTGLTFASALRAFLRQDPDVVMVGEIRDLETAEIAIKAAQTGHLVLSTLHTNSAAETLTRLLNMGVAGYNIASSVGLIMAQRLVRRLCPHCKQKENLNDDRLRELGFSEQQLANGVELYRAIGCKECAAGYRGRIGIYELLPMTDGIATLIMQEGNSLDIARLARQQGMQTLRDSGLEKARLGLTSLSEVSRVTE
ncbi:type IV-A pilus assembly ATPase PilB [Dongshaea marina]|uniref:type IV-A pilus assembly ATPase PilB n=1 Tax=Dongshaea marina TaxID=2047966 RepID=UPI000D3E4142|nr:type IV-A pilus assembly ATPase PilB [Dongshaea marina]